MEGVGFEMDVVEVIWEAILRCMYVSMSLCLRLQMCWLICLTDIEQRYLRSFLGCNINLQLGQFSKYRLS